MILFLFYPDDEAFANFTKLQSLDISHNRLTSLRQMALSDLDTLRDLNMSSNQISTIANGAFDSLINLAELDLSDNRLTELTDDAFMMLTSLSNLDLSKNRLDNRIFQPINHSPFLTQLDLSFNPLGSLPYLMLKQLDQLIFLEIRNASVSHIDTNAFVGLDDLQFLYLSDNLITELRRETFQPLPVISGIDLEGNPLRCSCETHKFQDWLRTQGGGVLQPDVVCYDAVTDADIDVESGDMQYLCYANATTPPPTTPPPLPPGDCDTDAQLELSVNDVTETLAVLEWTYELMADDSQLSVECRVYQQNPFYEETFRVDAGRAEIDVEPDQSYVCCGLVYVCGAYSCADFDTGLVEPECADVGMVVGLTVAAVCCTAAVLVALALVVHCVRKGCPEKLVLKFNGSKREHCNAAAATSPNLPMTSPNVVMTSSNVPVTSHDSRTTSGVVADRSAAVPLPPPLRPTSGLYTEINPYDAYEYIPAETLDPMLGPATFGNPGYLQKTPSQRADEKPQVGAKNDRVPNENKKTASRKNQTRNVIAEQYLHPSPQTTTARKPRRFTRPAQKAEPNADARNASGEVNEAFVSGAYEQPVSGLGQTNTTSSSSTLPSGKMDANSNHVDAGKVYLPPASLTLPPKKSTTIVNAKLRVMQDAQTNGHNKDSEGVVKTT